MLLGYVAGCRSGTWVLGNSITMTVATFDSNQCLVKVNCSFCAHCRKHSTQRKSWKEEGKCHSAEQKSQVCDVYVVYFASCTITHIISDAKFTDFPKWLHLNSQMHTSNSIWPWFCIKCVVMCKKTDKTCNDIIHLFELAPGCAAQVVTRATAWLWWSKYSVAYWLGQRLGLTCGTGKGITVQQTWWAVGHRNHDNYPNNNRLNRGRVLNIKTW